MNKINWLDHIANLLVVILGISIAFYLESYKDEKNNRKQEIQYMESLVEDLETDLEALDTLVKLNSYISNSLVKLSNASVGGAYDSDSLVTYLLSIQYNPPLVPQRTTYESLKASGRMDLISSFELRNKIVELYEQFYRGTKQYDTAIDQNLRDFYKPFYMKNIEYLSRDRVKEDFLRQPEFRNVLFAYRFLFLAKSQFYIEVKKQLEATLEDIKANN